MKILVTSSGISTEFETPNHPITAIVAKSGMKVVASTAYKIGPWETLDCMQGMSQVAWEYITQGPLFLELFNKLFKDDPVTLPAQISEFLTEYDSAVIHATGLIILLVESRFDGRKEVHLDKPETYLHPGVVYMLMSVIEDIQKIPLGGGHG